MHGLDHVQYLDKTDSNREKTQEGEIAIVSETDRIYLNTSATVEAYDPTLKRRIRVAKENSLTTVVWNPWARESARFIRSWRWRVGSDALPRTSNVAKYSPALAPGERHKMAALIQLEDF